MITGQGGQEERGVKEMSNPMQAISLEATRQLFHVDFWVNAMNEHIKHGRDVRRIFMESMKTTGDTLE